MTWLSRAILASTIGMHVNFFGAVHMERADRAAALDKAKEQRSCERNRVAFRRPPWLPIKVSSISTIAPSPPIGDKIARAESLTNTMRHEPCGFQGHAKNAVKLVRANALLGRAKKVDRLKPDAHRNMAGLKDSPDFDGEGLAAFIALADADARRFAAHQLDALGVSIAAMGAGRTIRPNARFDIGVSGFLVMEMVV